jgi:small basic protein
MLFEIENKVRVVDGTLIGTIRGYIVHQFDETRYIVEFVDANNQVMTAMYAEHSLELDD